MRKLILALPVVALALAAGLLFSGASGAFAAAEPMDVTARNAATADVAQATQDPAQDWNETAARPKPKPKPVKSVKKRR